MTTGSVVSGSLEYVYDNSDRLYQVKDLNDSGAVIEEYTYDLAGNRTSFKRDGLSAQSGFIYNNQDQLLEYYDHDLATSVTMTYDSEGNLISRSADTLTEYGYDYLGRLTQVVLDSGGGSEQVVDYTLDAQGRRIAKKIDGSITEKYLYNGFLHPSVVLDETDEPKAFFMGNMMIKVNSGSENGTYRIVRDYLGSVRAVVDVDTGDIAQRLEYDAWGNVLTDTNEGFQPFGYAGGIYDADTGLTKFGFRDYDPVVGRWTTKDPIGLSGGANVYEYAGSDPINFVDKTGLSIDQYDESMFDAFDIGLDSFPISNYNYTGNFSSIDFIQEIDTGFVGASVVDAFYSGADDGYIGWSNGFINTMSMGFVENYSDPNNSAQSFGSTMGNISGTSMQTALFLTAGGSGSGVNFRALNNNSMVPVTSWCPTGVTNTLSSSLSDLENLWRIFVKDSEMMAKIFEIGSEITKNSCSNLKIR